MSERFARTQLLLGKEGMEKLAASRVAVFGVGGVGGYCVEALARSGVGALDLIDHDRVSVSNVNRQLHATTSTVGQYKVDVAAARIADINPACRVRTFPTFFSPQTQQTFDFSAYSYVVDAIDTVTGKVALACNAYACGTPIISAMGAGNKLDPTRFRVADLFETSVCPLARVMRHELKKRGIPRLKVVYSQEPPLTPRSEQGCAEDAEEGARRAVPGSTAFVPSVVGLILAGEVVRDLIGIPSAGRAGE